jgi:alpha/beta superfamily hydrolase
MMNCASIVASSRKIPQKWIAVVLLGSAFSTSEAEKSSFDTTCLTESTLIHAYKDAIYNPKAETDWDKYLDDGLEKDSFRTQDGMTIRGLIWRAEQPKGYLLIAQRFKDFRDIGLDVYLYDYRGYGESSDIETTLEGMISDYSIRVTELNELPAYKLHFIFGISLGGVIFSNAMKGLHDKIDGVVFDSVPHAVPWYAFCPSAVDPIGLLPESCNNWLIIGAEKDEVIGRRASKLSNAASKYCGAKTKIEKHFGHIFMDSHKNTAERMSAAKRHFKQLLESHTNGK